MFSPFHPLALHLTFIQVTWKYDYFKLHFLYVKHYQKINEHLSPNHKHSTLSTKLRPLYCNDPFYRLEKLGSDTLRDWLLSLDEVST